MGGKCRVCTLDAGTRKEVEHLMLDGEPLRVIADRFGLEFTGLHRHRANGHIGRDVKDAQEVRDQLREARSAAPDEVDAVMFEGTLDAVVEIASKWPTAGVQLHAALVSRGLDEVADVLKERMPEHAWERATQAPRSGVQDRVERVVQLLWLAYAYKTVVDLEAVIDAFNRGISVDQFRGELLSVMEGSQRNTTKEVAF